MPYLKMLINLICVWIVSIVNQKSYGLIVFTSVFLTICKVNTCALIYNDR